MYKYFNPNPEGNLVGDCVIRAICASTGKSWDMVFDELTEVARRLKDMPSSNYVWAAYLKQLGYTRPMGSYDDMSRRMARDEGPEDYSGRRGRDMNTGRYTSRDSYGGHDSKESLMREMEELKLKLASM